MLEKLIKMVFENKLEAEAEEVGSAKKRMALNKLQLLGAVDGEEVTDIGRKILQLPDNLSPQFSRMIVEAEEEQVLEPVIAIVSILQAGSLLRSAKYSDFTNEKNSDLLAEWDVWNYIRENKKVDFYKLGIDKNHFFEALKNFKELKKVLNVQHSKNVTVNRKSILKCCLVGLITNCYIRSRDYRFMYVDAQTNPYHLGGSFPEFSYATREMFYTKDAVFDKSSLYYDTVPQVVIAIPKKIKITKRWRERIFNVLTFCTELNKESVQELLPGLIEEAIIKEYDAETDAVKITVEKSFAGQNLSKEITIDDSHTLLYEELKVKSEESNHYFLQNMPDSHIIVGGKTFAINYSSVTSTPYICMSVDDILATEQKELWLSDSSRRIKIYSKEMDMGAFRIDFLKECLKKITRNWYKKNAKRLYQQLLIGL